MKRAPKKRAPKKRVEPAPESPLFGTAIVPRGYVRVREHLRRLTAKKKKR